MRGLLLTLLLSVCMPCFAIISGDRASVDEYPSSLSLGNYHVCSGVRIRENVVMTARHCIEDLEIEKGSPLPIGQETGIDKSSFIINSIHTPENGRRDLALLVLSSPLEFGEDARLPEKALFPLRMMATGYGCEYIGGPPSEYLKEAKVRPNSVDSVSISFPSTPETGFYPSLCSGDSGGGSYTKDDEGLTLIGINSSLGHDGSFSAGNSRVARIDVKEVRDWIESIIGYDDPPACH